VHGSQVRACGIDVQSVNKAIEQFKQLARIMLSECGHVSSLRCCDKLSTALNNTVSERWQGLNKRNYIGLSLDNICSPFRTILVIWVSPNHDRLS
jgi:hypothetical protein